MSALELLIGQALLELDARKVTSQPDEFVNYLVQVGCVIMELFFRIHPYANGNGHLGRFLLTVMFFRYGFSFTGAFKVEPKPTDRARYSDCVFRYRNGDKDPLHTYIAECIDLT